ncbi:hypothetical protein NL676_038879 [Syzygium grande]|nr:hypothetical protein NL676_038879 [Syzygium grande]
MKSVVPVIVLRLYGMPISLEKRTPPVVLPVLFVTVYCTAWDCMEDERMTSVARKSIWVDMVKDSCFLVLLFCVMRQDIAFQHWLFIEEAEQQCISWSAWSGRSNL